MSGWWAGTNTTSNAPSGWIGALRGQFLAIGVSAAVLAVQHLMRPAFDHSVYLLGAPALVACAAFGGPWAGLTATFALTGGGFYADGSVDYAPTERALRPVLFAALGLTIAAIAWRLARRREGTALRARAQADREALLQATLRIVADALVVIDGDGKIRSFSEAAERLFGWSAAEVIGQSFDRLAPEGQDVVIEGEPDPGAADSHRQVTGQRKDGGRFPMELRIGETHTGEGRFFIVIVRDLSSMQEAERRSEELRDQLSRLWSLNSMGEMASVLSHELNQPLSAVANYLRAARNLVARLELEDDDLIDAVTRAGDQAVRAGEIIRTMRDLATRGGTLQKPESLAAIIGEIDFIVSLMARDADVRIFYKLYKGDDTVMADRVQIQQLVVNLTRNAIEAVTKYPHRQISISTHQDPHGNLVTTVEDSGPGVDASVADRLFQPLASTKPEGMGLGLSISSAIVENHRGRIWVEPSSLGGAAFSFLLARVGNHVGRSGRAEGVRHR